MQLIDTHCHIDLNVFDDDRELLIDRGRSLGIDGMVLPGVCRTGWDHILRLSDAEVDIFPAIGLHPMYLNDHHASHLEELRELIRSGRLTAIGEIGLDYYRPGLCRRKQQELFEVQLEMADSAGLPVLLHVRKAHDQALATLRRCRFSHGGIVHAYSGSLQQAGHYIGLGFKISFCGTVTYDRAKKIRRLASELSLNDMVIETDSPDLPPAANNGERNVPANLIKVVETLAQIRQTPVEEIANATSRNAIDLLGLPITAVG